MTHFGASIQMSFISTPASAPPQTVARITIPLHTAGTHQASLTRELDRRTSVTRLGDGVARNGRLSDEAMSRVFDTCAEFRRAIERHRAARVVAVLTSAARDAANGPAFQD